DGDLEKIWYLGDAIRNYMWEPSSLSMQDQVQGLRLPALKEFGMTTRYVACLIHFRSSTSSLKTYLSTFCSDSIVIAVTEGGSQISVFLLDDLRISPILQVRNRKERQPRPKACRSLKLIDHSSLCQHDLSKDQKLHHHIIWNRLLIGIGEETGFLRNRIIR
ncbi:hypothetical protein ACJX0J_042308, partial [Zea mays]